LSVSSIAGREEFNPNSLDRKRAPSIAPPQLAHCHRRRTYDLLDSQPGGGLLGFNRSAEHQPQMARSIRGSVLNPERLELLSVIQEAAAFECSRSRCVFDLKLFFAAKKSQLEYFRYADFL
jgi:hypothetical protein